MVAVVAAASLLAVASPALVGLAVVVLAVLLVLPELLELPILVVAAVRLDRLALWVVLAGLGWLLFPFHPAITLGQ